MAEFRGERLTEALGAEQVRARLRQLALGQQDVAQVAMALRIVGRYFDRFQQLLFGLGDAAQLNQNRAQIAVRHGEGGRQLDRFSKSPLRLLILLAEK